MIEIITNLWIGNTDDLNNIKILQQNNIQTIVNCTNNINNNNNHKFKFIRIPVNKKESYININKFIYNSIDKINPIIYNYLNSYKGILIFCDDMTIASTIIICYILFYSKIKIEDIIKYLKTKNNNINYLKYLTCLKSYENKIFNN